MEVWKFSLQIGGRVFRAMPDGARPLSVQLQGDTLCLWCLVDPKAQPTMRQFTVVGTGHYIGTEQLHHIGTVLDGVFVWHAFEVL